MQIFSSTRTSRLVRVFAFAAMAFVVASLSTPLQAQQPSAGKSVGRIYFGGSNNSGTDTGPHDRVVRGRVEDQDGVSVKGALVYLKEIKTSSMKSVLSDDQGVYRFVQIGHNLDYELWAQVDKKKTELKTISSFDDRAELIFNLKMGAAPATQTTAVKP